VYGGFLSVDLGEKFLSVNDKNHISEMARGRGAAARKAKALKAKTFKTKAKAPAPAVDKDAVVKKPRGRPRKHKLDPDQSGNELCTKDGDGYAEGMHTHLSLSHAVH